MMYLYYDITYKWYISIKVLQVNDLYICYSITNKWYICIIVLLANDIAVLKYY